MKKCDRNEEFESSLLLESVEHTASDPFNLFSGAKLPDNDWEVIGNERNGFIHTKTRCPTLRFNIQISAKKKIVSGLDVSNGRHHQRRPKW